MSKYFILDCLGYITLKLFGPLVRALPAGLSLSLGRLLGFLFYSIDLKHRAQAYFNIKTAFGNKLSAQELKRILKGFYLAFGQNLIEVLLIPLVDERYFKKYISIEGQKNIWEGFKAGEGVIFAGMHEGSWEFSNIISANLGFNFNMFAREQRYPRLNTLLNSYRRHKGCKLIQRENQLRQLIGVLKANESIGMTVDQGGKSGTQVKFFGRLASMPSGAVRIALKYGASLIPVFYTRVNGPYIKLFIEPPVRIKKTGDLEKDIQTNLQEIVHIFERYISKYPQEYLWTYRIWKYSKEKNILVLSDGKAGHLRQAEALTGVIGSYLNDKGIKADIDTVEIKFKNKFCLSDDTRERLARLAPDIVISCGSASAIVNHRISKENRAKSIAIMRPSVLSMRRFSLVIMPEHDRPPKRKNVTVIAGALNSIGPDYLAKNRERLNKEAQVRKELVLGILLGGDTRNFKLSSLDLRRIFFQVKAFLDNADGELLITTSRRTPAQVEALVEEEVKSYARCKSAVIANRKNLDYAVGGILGLSKIVLVSPESISMISEAASSGNYVVVFYPGKNKISAKHERFLQSMAQKGYIHLCRAGDTLNVLNRLWQERPQVKVLDNNAKLREGIKNIL